MSGPKPSVSTNDIKSLLEASFTKKEIAGKLGVSLCTIIKHSKGLSSTRTNTRWRCRHCDITGKQHFYKDAAYLCKSCRNTYTHKRNKDKFAEYMLERGGAHCMRCGYNTYVGALEFHHRDPETKDPKWSRSWGITRLRKELDKCDILCANCHREVHEELRQSTPSVGGSTPSGQTNLEVDRRAG